MSLAAIAVVSRRSGKPLYMRSFVESSDLLFGQYGQNETVGADFFGDILVEESLAQKSSEWSCEENDRLDEMKWKKPGAVGADACWVGLLCSMDSFNAYGYVTTNANYVVIVEDGIAPDNVQLQKSRDVELKTLISYVHRAYTESLLNPFSDINAKITSERFTTMSKAWWLDSIKFEHWFKIFIST
ncbi:hypothetical protein QTG54_010259 [Skeletonema marinoi]|uniref:Uncharacterized protein n=1 Tax=Skeletonema marinoi TaxID=267567 RepID=A0AAD9DAU3_9STRA|nr:hypothetical protein QTG54_010259 [Skeletonema marinoi]